MSLNLVYYSISCSTGWLYLTKTIRETCLLFLVAEHQANDNEISSNTNTERKTAKEVTDAYNKVSVFLEQNKILRQSMKLMTDLYKELHAKKENLTQMISNIMENRQEK